MDNKIIDQRFFDKNDAKKALSRAGITRFYEMKNGKVIVQESDAIQVSIQFEEGMAMIKPKFPQIGNSAQIVATIVLLVITFLLDAPFPWIIAIVGGQVFSFCWFYPKIKKLQTKVEQVLQ